MRTPKISIIMPIYNMAEYLDEALLSWTNQTLNDIEIICVDDASTDHSLEILRHWAEKDERVIIHSFEKNMTAWVARKWGIEHASAEYLLFADSDDTIEPCACEELYAEMTRNPVDILHFNANIINVNNLPDSRISSMQNFVAPYNGTLYGSEIFTACFDKKLYQFSLWNKLFSAQLCKQAIAGEKDWFLPKAQDKALYWMIALNAKSYRGIPQKCYYNYYFGRGGTGYNRLTIKQFARYCAMGDTANAMHDHLVEKGLLNQYQRIDEQNRQALLDDCITRFRKEIDEENKAEAFDLLLTKWRTVEVISTLARDEWYNRYAVAKFLYKSEALKSQKREPKVIAAYYHSCANGGAQRVMCDLCLLFASMGYEVIVFTDEEPSENDYPLPTSAKRVVLPHYSETDRSNYSKRALVLEKALLDYKVDIMLYHAWVSNIMLWDELVCKANHIAFIAHCHNVFSLPVLQSYNSVYNVIAPYLLADCVVTLSKTDQYFWKHFNNNVHVTMNPFTEGIESWKASDKLDDKQILWIGRLASEKRPYDALYILKKVIAEIPDAHLHIVGSSPNEKFMNDFCKKIVSMGLSSNVTMHGFQTQVRDFYQNASLFLMTSEYEGYSLTLQESKLAGLPCVMYELPYLTLCEGNRGIIPVENNTGAAAAAVIDLLTDREKRHLYAKEAREHIEELFEFDFAGKWTEIISSIGCDHQNTIPDVSYIMLETLLNHHEISLKKMKKTPKAVTSNRFIQKFMGGIQCCIDHGVLYTIKYAFVKLKRKIYARK